MRNATDRRLGPEFWAIIGTGVTITALLLTVSGWLRADIGGLGHKTEALQVGQSEIRERLKAVEVGQTEIRERLRDVEIGQAPIRKRLSAVELRVGAAGFDPDFGAPGQSG